MSIFNLFKKNEKAETQANNIDSPKHSSSEAKPEPQSNPVSDSTPNTSDTKKRVHNLIILDESGSMMSIYRPALTGVNETLQTIRGAQDEHKDQEHFVTLVAFDTGHYNQIYYNTPAGKAVDITTEQYHPCGGTPLYDAMGRAINDLRPNVEKDDYVLVTIITDGYENASREYNGRVIKSLVEEMKTKGWVFTYIGANQDVEAVAASMSIDNHLAFDTDEESTDAMFAKENYSRKQFFGKLSHNFSKSDLCVGYFDEADNEKDN